jgi:hypothetical protein
MHDSPLFCRIFSSDTGALWFLGLAFTLLHLIAGARYGFHRDELLTYSNARDLEWRYVVYPPVTAVLGRIGLALFGTSLLGFRDCGIHTGSPTTFFATGGGYFAAAACAVSALGRSMV